MRNFIAIIVICFFGSCTVGLIQKGYITNPPNICLFDSAQDLNMKLTGNTRFLEHQGSYAFTKHWGIASNLFLGNRLQYGGDLGAVYYNRINKRNYFECSAGYGYFNASSTIDETRIFFNKYYNQKITSIYHKLYLQPSYFFTFKKNDLGLTARLSLPFFTSYHGVFSYDPYCGEYNYPAIKYADGGFKNKLGLTIEPVITFRHRWKRVKFYMQFGLCFSKNIINRIDSVHWSDIDRYDGSQYPNYKNQQPLHANYFLNYGIEVSLNCRRKR